jgi:hypothetical protein
MYTLIQNVKIREITSSLLRTYFLAGFSRLELTVSRPGEKAVLAEDGWQYSLGRIKLPVLSTGLLATLPEKNSGNSSI